jgi:hypothetical protein
MLKQQAIDQKIGGIIILKIKNIPPKTIQIS